LYWQFVKNFCLALTTKKLFQIIDLDGKWAFGGYKIKDDRDLDPLNKVLETQLSKGTSFG
jgi:hypothetical protein